MNETKKTIALREDQIKAIKEGIEVVIDNKVYRLNVATRQVEEYSSVVAKKPPFEIVNLARPQGVAVLTLSFKETMEAINNESHEVIAHASSGWKLDGVKVAPIETQIEMNMARNIRVKIEPNFEMEKGSYDYNNPNNWHVVEYQELTCNYTSTAISKEGKPVNVVKVDNYIEF